MTNRRIAFSAAAAHRAITDFLIVLASCISFIATATGITTFMTYRAAVGQMPSYVVAGALSLMIAAGILKATREIRYAARGGQFVLWLSVLAILVTISVSFGIAFYWSHMRSGDVGQSIYLQSRTKTIEQLGLLRESVAVVDSRLLALAAYSADIAEKEDATGGGCDSTFRGDRIAGDGPRQRLRNRDSAIFASLAKEFSAKAARLDRLIADTIASARTMPAGGAAEAADALNLRLVEAENLVGTLPVAFLDKRLVERIERGRVGLIDEKTGRLFYCPDERLESHMAMVRSALALPSVTRVVVPDTFGRAGAYYAIERTWRTVGAGLAAVGTMIFGGSPTTDANEQRINRLDSDDIVPLSLGIAIDAFIILLSLTRPRPAFVGLESDLSSPPALPAGSLHDAMSILLGTEQTAIAALRPHMFYERGRPMVAVPLDGGSENFAASALMELLRDCGDVVPESRPAWWVRWQLKRIGSCHPSARAFLVFRFKSGVYAKLIKQTLQEAAEVARRKVEAESVVSEGPTANVRTLR